LPTLRRRLPPLPARILLRVCMPISPSAARPTPRHDRRRIGTAPPTSRGNSLRPPSALAAAGAAFAITDDALDHVAGADVEIVVDAYAGSTGTGEESGEVPGDQRLTSAAGAARQRTADAAGREAAIDDAGRAAHRIVRIVEAGGETGEPELSGGEVDADRAAGHQRTDGAGARIGRPCAADGRVRNLSGCGQRRRRIAVNVMQVAAVVMNQLIPQRLRNRRSGPGPAAPVEPAAGGKA